MTTTATATATAAPSLSAAAFLFGGGDDSVQQLADALKENGVVGAATSGLRTLSKAGLDAVGGQIASVAHDLLDIGLDTLILEGWRKFGDLHAAAQRTRAALGSSEVLDLATHSITSSHQPRLELRLDDVPLATVEFDLSLTFALKAAVATVRDGLLVSLHSGVCDLEGTLAVGDKPLASRSGHFQLPLMVHLGSGLPLLGDAVGHPPPAPAT
ncbi:hypothetical protein FHX52_2795 [Humibacillus xanthopallidus]|uniref:Uncharacterized protein n=1 Tax=Humibacillus xanthopallidus TaxID=412689 RepID=A0A543PPS5_9MICO|nr:hypothetical protein [Humibacillus xanthopallidus]TQN46089.1 hypothetical protein FHX52_2795 [Humibacillus xanthopallidus]